MEFFTLRRTSGVARACRFGITPYQSCARADYDLAGLVAMFAKILGAEPAADF
jgi:hypothetical protein